MQTIQTGTTRAGKAAKLIQTGRYEWAITLDGERMATYTEHGAAVRAFNWFMS